jgi:hypothetical protein
MRAQCELERITDGLGGRSSDNASTDAESAVVVDAGDDFHLGAISQEEATDDVHLPQLHRARALPALVVRAWSAPRSRLDEVVSNEGPIDRGATRRGNAFDLEVRPDRPRSPARMRSAHLDHSGLDHRRHLMWDVIGLGGFVD